jgi:hypothetical protein
MRGWFVYDKTWASIIKSIIEACQLDPEICTHNDLDEMDPWVACLTCCNGDISTSKEMYPWRQAVRDKFTNDVAGIVVIGDLTDSLDSLSAISLAF